MIKMKLVLLSIAATFGLGVQGLSWVEQAPQMLDTPSIPEYLSFMDSVYGEVVQSPQSEEHKRNMLEGGKVQLKNEEEDSIHLKSHPLQTLSDKQLNYAHTHYLKMQSKVKLPSNDDTSDILMDQGIFGGILTYAHLQHFNCFDPELMDDADEHKIDIAIVGAPFDTGVSFRPGARFGPEAIRRSARRIGDAHIRSTKKRKNYPVNPYDETTHNYTIVDCGDVSLSPFDNRIALNQLYRGERAIHRHQGNVNKIPKIITLGGDHTITLMALRSVSEQLGKPVHIIHFDSHIDTWDPKVLGGGITNYMSLNHGTFLHYAHEQGYIHQGGNFHVGIRAPYIDEVYDGNHDLECGFNIISAKDIDKIGVSGIIRKLKDAIKTNPVYISVDIDVLDPATAPGTGTMEIGGFTGRELLSILDGLKGIELVGGDVVEVSPPYDTNSEITSLAATSVVDSLLRLMVV
ncbi:arginase family-domain-containing protein [Scheffersomyces xylosifermentans]|uniref:arginase family-domain-containing protein n=1 Tax=Scheffersomyces xylosifermentans TaxID=1304137 RepID=UPI00315DFB60